MKQVIQKTGKPEKVKKRRCKVPSCRKEFLKRNAMQSVCDPKCAADWAAILRERKERKVKKEERKIYRAEKERQMSKGDWEKIVERNCNAYIRYRDRNDPCISCGKFSKSGIYDAGHFRAKGVIKYLRFNPDNIHKQCVSCNHHQGSNATEYEMRLIKKIGVERVEWLKGPHDPPKYSIHDLKIMNKMFLGALKDMKDGKIDCFHSVIGIEFEPLINKVCLGES